MPGIVTFVCYLYAVLLCLSMMPSLMHKTSATDDPPGHLRPLGSHQDPETPGIDILTTAPSPQEYFEQYIEASKPFLVKGLAKNMPAFTLWKDDYLRFKYGHVKVDVEQGKKENRSNSLWTMPLGDFLERYNDSDLYMVHTLPREMMGDIWIIKSLLCGGFLSNLMDVVTWFSSGGTKSVLHLDALDNINCLLDGKKELLMVSKSYVPLLNLDHPEGSYSSVDVDSVDMYRYPELGRVPWYNVSMEPGDCLYIPYRWAHQVRSTGRNLAINLWFVHMYYFDYDDCGVKGELPEFAILSDYEIQRSHEQIKSEMLTYIFDNGGSVTVNDIETAVTFFGASEEELLVIFNFLDQNGDGEVTVNEVRTVDQDEFNKLLSVLEAEDDDEVEEEFDETEGDEGEPDDEGFDESEGVIGRIPEDEKAGEEDTEDEDEKAGAEDTESKRSVRKPKSEL